MSRSQSSPKTRPGADFSAPDLQDGRYGRFGLWSGIGIALAVHLLFFALPRPGSFEESQGDTERGMVARTYRQRAFIPGQGAGNAPEAPAPPAPGGPRPAPRRAPAEGGVSIPAEEAALQAAAAAPGSQSASGSGAWGSTVGAGDEAGGSQGNVESAASATVSERAEPRGLSSSLPQAPDPEPAGAGSNGAATAAGNAEWDRMLAALSAKSTEAKPSSAAPIAAAETRAAAKPKPQPVKPPAEEDDHTLDKRIRMTVVSYPPTAIEKKFPPIPYPDVGVSRSRLEAGICRVYYRVWVDASGDIEREELKSPSTSEEIKKYEAFIQAVKDSVAQWQFDQVKAQVHIDVLFEIK